MYVCVCACSFVRQMQCRCITVRYNGWAVYWCQSGGVRRCESNRCLTIGKCNDKINAKKNRDAYVYKNSNNNDDILSATCIKLKYKNRKYQKEITKFRPFLLRYTICPQCIHHSTLNANVNTMAAKLSPYMRSK